MSSAREFILSKLSEAYVKKKEQLREVEEDGESILKVKTMAQEQGDLSENTAYTVAVADYQRNELEKAALVNWLNAFEQYSNNNVESQYVSVGSTVIVKDKGKNETVCVQIAPQELGYTAEGEAFSVKTDFGVLPIQILTEESPIGKAIMGQMEGDTVIVHQPRKDEKFEVMKILRGEQ